MLNSPPSRTTNPFATCWTRPGALSFRFPAAESAESLAAKLAANSWWGEIIGPHGSGKSTLIEALKPVIQHAGRDVVAVAIHDGQRRLPTKLLTKLSSTTLIVVDGYEQLNWFQQQRLKYRCRRAGAGMLVTAHAATGLPALIALAPDLPLVQQLVTQLCERSSSRVTPADVAASHAGRSSNVRDIFFDLYDRHERLRTAD